MSVYGIKNNKCILPGVQGVCDTVVYENTSGSSVIFSINGPKNNTRYVFKEYSNGVFGLMPENPTGDYNFGITLKDSSGFLGILDAQVTFYYNATTSTEHNQIYLKWDNPDFDPTDNYTVLHIHVWYDGINYCGHIDGYNETT